MVPPPKQSFPWMLTTMEVAGLLGVSRRTVRRLVSDGRLKAYSQGPGRGRHMIFIPASVHAEMERRGRWDAQPPPP